jgi:CRP/FNR family transcriptional regulator
MAVRALGASPLAASDISPDTHLGSLLAALAPDRRDALVSLGQVRSVGEGTVLVADGADASEVGYVLEGILGMTKRLADGRIHIVGLLVPTDFYGRIFDGPCQYSIEALSPARLCTFPRARFERFLREDPAAERVFLLDVLDELDSAREWLLLLSGARVTERLAGFLMILARRLTRSADARGPLTVHVPIPRAALAHYLGTRPETLSRAVHQLEDEGALRIIDPNRFEISDLSRLTEVMGDDFVLEDARSGA